MIGFSTIVLVHQPWPNSIKLVSGIRDSNETGALIVVLLCLLGLFGKCVRKALELLSGKKKKTCNALPLEITWIWTCF